MLHGSFIVSEEMIDTSVCAGDSILAREKEPCLVTRVLVLQPPPVLRAGLPERFIECFKRFLHIGQLQRG